MRVGKRIGGSRTTDGGYCDRNVGESTFIGRDVHDPRDGAVSTTDARWRMTKPPPSKVDTARRLSHECDVHTTES